MRDLPRRRPPLAPALDAARLEPPDAAGRDDRGLPQPHQALHARLSRGLLLQAARRLLAARAVRRRHHRALGLPLGPHLPGAAGGRCAARAGGARPPRADLRPRGRLHRAAGRRHRRAQERQSRPPGPGGRHGPPRGRHRRRALPARRGRNAPRGAALHPDQRPALEPEALPLLDAGLLPQDARRDEPHDGALGRRRAARADARDRRALQRRARPRPHPPAALRRGRRRLVRHAAPDLRAGHARALRHARPGRPRPARVRAPDDPRDGLRGLLPDRLGLRALRQGQRHHRGPGPRLGGGLDRGLCAAHHRSRPAPVRPALRALPQPRAQDDAGHRHRLLRARPRARDRLCHREVRARARGADHHVLEARGEGLGARRRARHGPALRRRRPHRQARAGGRQGRLRGVAQAQSGSAQGLRRGRARAPGRRHGAPARGPRARRLDPRRRRRDRRPPARRVPAAAAEGPRVGARDAVPDGGRRGARPAQDGLPRPAQPRRHRRGRAHHPRVGRRRSRRSLGAAAGRPAHLRHARARRHARRLPVRVERYARRPPPGQADRVRGPDRARGALSPGPDGQHPGLRAAQERPRARELPRIRASSRS